MYLKKMEIVGFKSFADRTKIEFDQGVTAVVGPNGSGKSNIVESLRWVLGEQSAKSLRGGKMPDVIFAGTEKRRALNYAEVIATFDNSDDYLAGHDEDDEVVISRRLYRNGDSDFLINGKKCRLRDIHDLFTDTGLGRDSLSIISQGRIESVFNSKPEERRSIFEEAAGVLKYKNRKAETESKLASTQDNLDRLEDIIFELNGQLTPLRAQRDVALKFQGLESERVSLALSVLIAQIVNERQQYEHMKAELKTVNQELAEQAKNQSAYEAEVAGLKARRSQVESDQEKLQAENFSLTELKNQLERQIERFDLEKSSSEKSQAEREERAKELGRQVSQLEAELESLIEKQAKLEAEKSRLDQEILELEAEVQGFSESPEAASERLRTSYLELVEYEAERSNQLTRNQAELDSIRKRLSEQSESDKENQEKYEALRQELEKLEASLAELSAEIENLLEDYKSQSAKLVAMSSQEEKLSQDMYAKMDVLNKQRARLASLENIRDSHSNLYQGVRSVMQAAGNIGGIIGVVADLLTFDSKYNTAMDIALAGGSQNIITEDEQAAKRAINYLREKRLGRATFLPLTTIKPREFNRYQQISGMPGFIDLAINLVNFDDRLYNAVSSLLGTTIIVDTTDHATAIARSMGYSVRIVTLEGSQINPGGSYAGGAGKRNNTTFTSSEIEQLSKEIKISEATLKSSEQALQALQKEKTGLEERLTEARQLGEDKRFAEKSLSLQVEQSQKQKANLQALMNLSAEESGTGRMSELEVDNSAIKQELEKIAGQKAKLDQELEEVKSNSQAFNALKNTKTDSLNQAKIRQSEMAGELRHISSDSSRIKASLSQLTREIEELTSRDDLSQLDDKSREQAAAQLQETEEKLQAFAVKQVSLRFEREDLQAQMEDLEAQNQEAIQLNQELHTQKTRLELQLEQTEAGLRKAQERLVSDYEMSFDEAMAKAEALDVELDEAEGQLRRLERQIRALGPVNLEAIPQFDEVNERYEFLASQKDDLLEAKNMLMATINDMNDEVVVRFKSTFDAIRSSFQSTFSQMFSGGKADLELTSDDLLTAGVEIKVQPPGKKLASLNLMSGGEKALTALALIFAILRVRTVPFVVLDEVEAALDEANVKRFGDYMNHFDNSNQFIVVTHRRGTMAAAGAMYGVTMADAGVSKIISVRLEDHV
ncbi:chromosome segregation protein SMC [Lactococcus termiticola]|uniref:Chromosome partition protein Smc n=1 Tax=Lactococcus termiticola TaxID=2169526 RepID=A0A2R5HF73_9LACT|nr:chromosome segregation protein SMC [Lactococcus termiticola]GBG96707.1 chromosome segregation protein SMC [Lactococcus termiticola]